MECFRTSAFLRLTKIQFLGLFGFAGFLGFWTYGVDKTIFSLVFFVFFGFFGFFYEGRMSDTFMDERYLENKLRAQATANKTTVALVFLATLILGQGKLIGNLEYRSLPFSSSCRSPSRWVCF